MNIILYFIVALINVFLHVFKNILVIKSTKLKASIANCVCYTFAAVVIKCIADTELWIAITVQAITNFTGNWIAMWLYEIIEKKKGLNMSKEQKTSVIESLIGILTTPVAKRKGIYISPEDCQVWAEELEAFRDGRKVIIKDKKDPNSPEMLL